MNNNFQIGNQAKCIIRAYHAGAIGDTIIKYDNQPYTVLTDVRTRFQFKKLNSDTSAGIRNLSYGTDFIDSVSLYDINLNDKILNLICPKSESKLISTMQNCDSDDNNYIYFSLPTDKVYQVFVYDIDGQLESAFDYLESGQIEVKRRNTNYLVFYSYYDGKAFSLDKRDNLYLTLDFEMIGNTNEETSKC